MIEDLGVGGILRIAVVSDIHADIGHGKDEQYSHLDMDVPDGDPRHPCAALHRLLNQEKLHADMIVCPGDLGCKAKPATIQYAWRQLHDLARVLGTKLVLATPGNHDFDSRIRYNDHDPRHTLQNLNPHFPLEDETKNASFWANHWVSLDHGPTRVVLLDSSAYHGTGEEYRHGRVDDVTVNRIEQELLSQGPRRLNLLVCHHHPQVHDNAPLDDYSQMIGGEALLAQVCHHQHGHWLVVHGHRHHPKLYYAQSAANAPAVVFSAGSLCAVLAARLATVARNQFYMIDLHLERFDEMNGCAGTFRSWDFAYGRGWHQAGSESGLPAWGGFGLRTSTPELAAEIAVKFPEALVKGETIRARMPKLCFLTSEAVEEVRAKLVTDHDMDLMLQNGQIVEIGRRV